MAPIIGLLTLFENLNVASFYQSKTLVKRKRNARSKIGLVLCRECSGRENENEEDEDEEGRGGGGS